MEVTKSQLRREYRARRAALSATEKQRLDAQIASEFLKLSEYQNANTILFYLSLPQEIDTTPLLLKAWADGKRTAVPRCISGTSDMEYYLIRSMDDVSIGSFSIREPVPARCEKLSGFPADTLCIVPGFCFSKHHYRVGYGGGYYDRFLADYTGLSAGLCYHDFLRESLPTDTFDVPVDILLTECGRMP